MTKSVVGVDVSKGKLDVGVNDEKRVQTWTNDVTGCTGLGEWVVGQGVSLVVVEASGGYEAAIVSELVSRGQAVALVNMQAHYFFQGLLA